MSRSRTDAKSGSERPWRSFAILAASLAAVPAAALALLWCVTRFGWLCPVNELTGLLCPSCGMTRAAVALFSGDVFAAVAWNPFILLVPAYPVAAAILLAVQAASVRKRGRLTPVPKRAAKIIAAAAIITVAAFTVARNI